MTNTGQGPIRDWIARLEMPSRFVTTRTRFRTELTEKETREYRFFQDINNEGPLLPGDERRILSISYEVTTDIHYRHQADFERLVKVAVYVEGKLAGEASRPFRELQNF
jgi:hypothetical protein